MSDTLRDRVEIALGQQYQLESEIGRGGMAVVYRARDSRLNRSVAIKVLPPELAYDPAIRMRFTREAQTAAQLSHPHIVPIFDVGDREGIAYFVMAVIPENLGIRLANDPRQPIDEVRRLLAEIADALAYAHTRGVIHRDIKPDNILLEGERSRAVVTDFGIARAIESGSRLTVTGNAVGTPTYMSPEQALGDKELDGRSDIYSLGVLGYQMLTGRVPFSAGNSMALLLKHVGETPRPIAELRAEAPRELREAIERALMKSPDDRWPTAAALRDALLSNRGTSASWRDPEPPAAPRDQVRVESVRDYGSRRNLRAPETGTGGTGSPLPARSRTSRALIMEPPEFASFAPEQRKEIRLWHGRIGLYDRIKAMRGYTLLTLAAYVGAMGGIVAAVEAGFPPAVLAPIVPFYMTRKLARRAKSLRAAGLRLRRVLLMPRAKWVLPKEPPSAAATAKVAEAQLAKLASPAVLESANGAAIRRAAEDRAAILGILGTLPKEDRALLPDVEATANALVDRVADLAGMLHGLEGSVDTEMVARLDSRIAEVERHIASPEDERRLSLLQRQKRSLDELTERRSTLARQLDNAVLALGNLKLDLIKLRSSGLQSALSDVSTATREARALSREISTLLHAAAEVRDL